MKASGRVLPYRRTVTPSPEEWRRVERELRIRIRIYRAKVWLRAMWPALAIALCCGMIAWELFL